MVLDAEGGSGDLKKDIKRSGLDTCEEDDSIPYIIYLKQAEYFLVKGLEAKALNRLNIALRLCGEECLGERKFYYKESRFSHSLVKMSCAQEAGVI